MSAKKNSNRDLVSVALKMTLRLLVLFSAFFLNVAHADESELFRFTSPNGQNPRGGLVQDQDGNFYGTTSAGAKFGFGTVFKMTPTGVLTTLYIFDNGSNGAFPNAELIQGSDGNFYGTTLGGGDSSQSGTVFKITPAGALTTLHTFNITTSDGGCPTAGLILARDGNFYGTTTGGGACHNRAPSPAAGTIFRITPTGVLTNIYRFGGNGDQDGMTPYSGLTEGADGNLYGTTMYGGTALYQGQEACSLSGCGTAYKITTSGSLTTLYSFTDAAPGGTHPLAGLTQGADGSFYGVTAYYVATDSTSGPSVFKINVLGQYSKVADLPPGYGKTYGKLLLAGDGNLYGASSDANAIFQVSPLGALKTIYTFDSTTGSAPIGSLIQGSNGNLYGTISGGGQSGNGSVFKITYAGSLTTLNTFDNLFGAYPAAALVQVADGSFFGTTNQGGKFNGGTVFKVSASGAFTALYHFDGIHGAYPRAALTLGNDGNLYGTTESGGTYGYGVVFSITPAGVLSLLYSFDGVNGADPEAALLKASDGKFYGTTASGGRSGYGTVFVITPSGTFNSLYSFNVSDGAFPLAALVQGRDGNFYGTTSQGGGNSCAGQGLTCGTVFQITAVGSLTVLHRFECCEALPKASLVQGTDDNFYGTTYGAISSYGSIFKITSSGVFTSVHTFDPNHDSANPLAALIQASDGNFYGTSYGGSSVNGDVYQLTPDGQVRQIFAFNQGNGFGVVSGVIQGTDGAFYGTTVTGAIGLDGTDFGRIYRLTVAPKLHLSATSIDFGGQPQGKTGFNSVVVSNLGNGALNITSVTLSGAAEFSLGNDCTGVLMPAAQCEIAVRFLPTAAGNRTATLTISSTAPSSPDAVTLTGTGIAAAVFSMSPSSLDFGNQVVGSTGASKRVTLTNLGGESFAIYSDYTTGYFSQTNNCPGTLAAGASCSFDVTFIPNTTGSQTGGLTINCNLSNCPATVNLSGVGAMAAVGALSVSPSSLSFGAWPQGMVSSNQTVTLTNVGNATLNISGVAFTGDYSGVNNCGAVLSAGASCRVDVKFAPNGTGDRAGTMTIDCNASGCPGVVSLMGTGGSPATAVLSMSPMALSFGNQDLGTVSATQAITLMNTGNAPLNIAGVMITGDYLLSNGCGNSLAAGASCFISVQFTPTVAGNRSGAITLNCDATGCPGAVVLSGTGVSQSKSGGGSLSFDMFFLLLIVLFRKRAALS